jgi:Uma2 family endonuclease
MSPAIQTPPRTEFLLTAEQYLKLPDDGRYTELVKGKVIEMTRPTFRHGACAGNVYWMLRQYVEPRDLGWVLTCDTGVVTQRDPDTVRGPDVAFYSYQRVPKGQAPDGFGPAPELVFEVLSPSNRPSAVTAKIAEYFTAGVKVVCVLDPDAGQLAVYTPDELPRRYSTDEELVLPELFPDFRVPVRQFLA